MKEIGLFKELVREELKEVSGVGGTSWRPSSQAKVKTWDSTLHPIENC